MSLKSIIASKEKFIQDTIDTFQSQWELLKPNVQKGLIRLFKSGEYSIEAIETIFNNNGFTDLATETARQFNKAFKYSEQISRELGYKFVLTEENAVLFEQMNQLTLDTLVGTGRANAIDLKRFAIESQIEERTTGQIMKGFETIFENSGRRLITEVNTGIRSYNASIGLESMKNADVELFYYFGPYDGHNRDSCKDTLGDPRQSTGWTSADVQSSGTPFIDRGGWNCRHEWVAFTKELVE